MAFVISAEVDDSKAVKGFKSIGEAATKVGQIWKNVGSQPLGKTFEDLKTFASQIPTSVGLSGAAVGVFAVSVQQAYGHVSALLKSQREFSGVMLGAVSATGQGSAELLDYAKAARLASGNTLSVVDALRQFSQGGAIGLGMKEQVAIMDFAARRARQLGTDIRAEAEAVTSSLATGAAEQLKKIGLLVGGLDAIRARFDSLKGIGAFDQLTEEARKLIMKEEVLKELAIENQTELSKMQQRMAATGGTMAGGQSKLKEFFQGLDKEMFQLTADLMYFFSESDRKMFDAQRARVEAAAQTAAKEKEQRAQAAKQEIEAYNIRVRVLSITRQIADANKAVYEARRKTIQDELANVTKIVEQRTKTAQGYVEDGKGGDTYKSAESKTEAAFRERMSGIDAQINNLLEKRDAIQRRVAAGVKLTADQEIELKNIIAGAAALEQERDQLDSQERQRKLSKEAEEEEKLRKRKFDRAKEIADLDYENFRKFVRDVTTGNSEIKASEEEVFALKQELAQKERDIIRELKEMRKKAAEDEAEATKKRIDGMADQVKKMWGIKGAGGAGGPGGDGAALGAGPAAGGPGRAPQGWQQWRPVGLPALPNFWGQQRGQGLGAFAGRNQGGGFAGGAGQGGDPDDMPQLPDFIKNQPLTHKMKADIHKAVQQRIKDALEAVDAEFNDNQVGMGLLGFNKNDKEWKQNERDRKIARANSRKRGKRGGEFEQEETNNERVAVFDDTVDTLRKRGAIDRDFAEGQKKVADALVAHDDNLIAVQAELERQGKIFDAVRQKTAQRNQQLGQRH